VNKYLTPDINKMNFVTIFPTYRENHFFKDPGQIPYRISRLGLNTTIVCYKNESSYPVTSKYIKIKTVPNNFINTKFNSGLLFYLLFNSKKINILNVFHFSYQSLLLAFFYKLLNKKGFVYLKMDACHYSGRYEWQNIFDKNINSSAYNSKISLKKKIKTLLIKEKFTKKVDLWSVEDDDSRIYFENQYEFLKNKIITLYNGHAVDLSYKEEIRKFKDKENIILTAGRLGSYQKATEILLKAFSIIAKEIDWSLHLAGNIDIDFLKEKENFLKMHPELLGSITFHGPMSNVELYKLYNQSKIFCLPSRYEGFAIVIPEAMYFRNAIITTYNVSIRDKIAERRFGILVEKDNVKELAEAILKMVTEQDFIEECADNAFYVVRKEFNWEIIILKLFSEIMKRLKM